MEQFQMLDLMMDLKVLEMYRAPANPVAKTTSSGTTSSGNSFTEVLSSALSGGETGYDSYFDAASKKYDIPASLLKAVGRVESAFQSTAVSCCGAQGIMQLMPATARAMGVNDSFDPAQNIMGGARYLRQMLDRYHGNVSFALAAYNAGPGAVDRCGSVPSFTKDYVSRVLGFVDNFSDASVSQIGTNDAARRIEQADPVPSPAPQPSPASSIVPESSSRQVVSSVSSQPSPAPQPSAETNTYVAPEELDEAPKAVQELKAPWVAQASWSNQTAAVQTLAAPFDPLLAASSVAQERPQNVALEAEASAETEPSHSETFTEVVENTFRSIVTTQQETVRALVEQSLFQKLYSDEDETEISSGQTTTIL